MMMDVLQENYEIFQDQQEDLVDLGLFLSLIASADLNSRLISYKQFILAVLLATCKALYILVTKVMTGYLISPAVSQAVPVIVAPVAAPSPKSLQNPPPDAAFNSSSLSD